MTPKYATFASALQGVLNKYGRNTIKLAIGDSVGNNRTVTVNQLIRFLSTRRTLTLRVLGAQLQAVYALSLITEGLEDLRWTNERTDAFDINEFLAVYNAAVLQGDAVSKRFVSRTLPIAA